jgi:hypothetical protein
VKYDFAGIITEGTMPVPPYCPWDYSDDDVLPVHELSDFGRNRSGGGDTPVSFFLVFGNFL